MHPGDSTTPVIGWKVHSLSPRMASVRYRAMLPLLGLEERGYKCRVFRKADKKDIAGLDALVIVKSFTADDLSLAKRVSATGARIIIDLCDNIFINSYGGNAGKSEDSACGIFVALAKYADAIVTSTEPLAEVIRNKIGTIKPIYVVPDGIETNILRSHIRARLADRKCLERPTLRSCLSAAMTGIQLLLNRGQKLSSVRQIRNSSLSRPDVQRILWFGNHGATHARFGMLDLLELKMELETVAQEFNVELVVVSNSKDKYLKHIKPLAIPSRYVEWSQSRLDRELVQASVVIVPNSRDSFSICKSANRATLALSSGVPVVATATPALQPLAGCIILDDFLAGLRLYLTDQGRAIDDVKRAQLMILTHFSQSTIVGAWQSILNDSAIKTMPSYPDH